MKRIYTSDERRRALRILAANSTEQTHRETGIPKSTLRQWRRAHLERSDADNLRELRQRLIAEALEMAVGLKKISQKAPLNQRATALNQMVDKILRISEVLEEEEDEVQETKKPAIRIEYVDEHGQVHSTPPGAEFDSE
jgi:transposase-like protein